MAERTMDWSGAERRSGDDRRVAVMERADDRRHAERRRGGVGTSRPNPLEELLKGVEVRESEPFQPRAVGRATGSPTAPDERAAFELRPAHEPHDAIESLAAIAGHPIHPMLVPLPIGAFVGAIASDVACAVTGDAFFARASRLLTGTALVTGLAAGAVGAVDFLGRGRIRSHTAAWVHAGGNLVALGIGAASLAARARTSDPKRQVLPAGLALGLAAGTVLLVTGWLGGELSYRHRIGVMDEEHSS